MPDRFDLRVESLLVFAVLLEGCGYYGCKDDLKADYVPDQDSIRWQEGQTLEVDFGGALRPPTEVDPRRFALLRYDVTFAKADPRYCAFDLCYRPLDPAQAIPESLDWDPAQPSILRLHFSDPIFAGACEPWPHAWADFQALELIYLGVETGYAETGYAETGDAETGDAEPDQLAYVDERPIEAFGSDHALRWLEAQLAGGAYELDGWCEERGGFGDTWVVDRWVDCP